MHEVHVLCQGSTVGQEGICSVFCLLVFRIVHHVYTCITQVAVRKQHPCPSNARRWFRQFLVIYRCLDKGGGGGVSCKRSLVPFQRKCFFTCRKKVCLGPETVDKEEGQPPLPPSSLQGGLSAGMDRQKVVMCPRRGIDPASGHPRAQKPPLGRGPSPPVSPAWAVRCCRCVL